MVTNLFPSSWIKSRQSKMGGDTLTVYAEHTVHMCFVWSTGVESVNRACSRWCSTDIHSLLSCPSPFPHSYYLLGLCRHLSLQLLIDTSYLTEGPAGEIERERERGKERGKERENLVLCFLYVSSLHFQTQMKLANLLKH